MNAGNIFEAFFLAKEKIAKEPDIFSDPEYMKILQSVKNILIALSGYQTLWTD